MGWILRHRTLGFWGAITCYNHTRLKFCIIQHGKTQQVTLLRIAANSYGQTKWENPWWKVSWRILGRHVISPQQETQNNIQYSHHPRTNTQDCPFACFNHSPPTMASLFRTKSWHFLWIPTIFLDTNVAMLFFLEHPIQQLPLPVKLGGSSDIEGLVVLRWGIYCLCPSKTAIKSHLFKMIMLK